MEAAELAVTNCELDANRRFPFRCCVPISKPIEAIGEFPFFYSCSAAQKDEFPSLELSS